MMNDPLRMRRKSIFGSFGIRVNGFMIGSCGQIAMDWSLRRLP